MAAMVSTSGMLSSTSCNKKTSSLLVLTLLVILFSTTSILSCHALQHSQHVRHRRLAHPVRGSSSISAHKRGLQKADEKKNKDDLPAEDDKNAAKDETTSPTPSPTAKETVEVVESAFGQFKDGSDQEPNGFMDAEESANKDEEQVSSEPEQIIDEASNQDDEDDDAAEGDQDDDTQDEDSVPEENLSSEPEQIIDDVNNQDDGKEDDKNQDKDSVLDEYGFAYVKMPTLLLELGVDVVATSRAYDVKNDAAIAALIENYFENLLPQEFMGSNYISSDLDAKMEISSNFGNFTPGGSFLDFKLKGNAEYEGEPVPSDKEVKERLIYYFATWGSDDLESYLAANGIAGTRVNNLYVGDVHIDGNGTVTYDDENSLADTGDSDKPVGLITGLTLFFVCMFVSVALLYSHRRQLSIECHNFCKCVREKSEKRKTEKRGWGLYDEEGSDTAVSLPAAVPTDTNDRTSIETTIVQWFKAKTGMFNEEGSENTAGPTDTTDRTTIVQWFKAKIGMFNEDRSENAAGPKDTNDRTTIVQWFKAKTRKQREESPSEVLQHVHVVVENDHALQQQRTASSFGIKDRNRTLESVAHSSAAQFSATTVPVSNYGGSGMIIHGVAPRTVNVLDKRKVVHPKTQGRYECEDDNVQDDHKVASQKTQGRYAYDDDDMYLEDPIVRYAPPNRAKSRLYPGQSPTPSPTKNGRATPEVLTPTTVKSTPSPPKSKHMSCPDDEDEDFGILGDWTKFLNPCMISLPMFQYESEKLDDLVAAFPRDKSVLDRSAEESRSPSPPRRPSPRKKPSRTNSKSKTRAPNSSSRHYHRQGEV